MRLPNFRRLYKTDDQSFVIIGGNGSSLDGTWRVVVDLIALVTSFAALMVTYDHPREDRDEGNRRERGVNASRILTRPFAS